MAHGTLNAYVGTYGSVEDASADYDAVAELRKEGATGHLEAAVMRRDQVGKLTMERHDRLGGLHLSHAPSQELNRISDQIEANVVALVVLGSAEDAAQVGKAATRASSGRTTEIEHLGLADGYFADGGGSPSSLGDDPGFEDGSVGHLGV